MTMEDCDGNGVFDDCDPDCDQDGTPDACDTDDDGDGIPDECDADSCGMTMEDCDNNGIFDECDPDCDQDGTPDACDEDDEVGGLTNAMPTPAAWSWKIATEMASPIHVTTMMMGTTSLTSVMPTPWLKGVDYVAMALKMPRARRFLRLMAMENLTPVRWLLTHPRLPRQRHSRRVRSGVRFLDRLQHEWHPRLLRPGRHDQPRLQRERHP